MKTKICSKCKLELSIEFFNKNSKKKDGLQTFCKECNRQYNRSTYWKYKDSILEKNKINKTRYKQEFTEYKKTLSCETCGENHPATLDFHHHEDNKEFNISRKAGDCRLNTLMKEINKCKVLCSNCHRKLHYKKKQEN